MSAISTRFLRSAFDNFVSSSGRSTFREATRLDSPAHVPKDGNSTAWLVVLVLIVLAALGFAWFLQQERSAPYQLPGEAPSAELLSFVDPILAPLETGTTRYSPESLSRLPSSIRAEREKTSTAPPPLSRKFCRRRSKTARGTWSA